MAHWIFRVGDGKNFKNGLPYKIWGIKSKYSAGIHFKRNVAVGDILWFCIKGAKLIAVASFKEYSDRQIGPLVNITLSDEELGWNKGDWDLQIFYEDMYDLENFEIPLCKIKGQSSIYKYYEDKCPINLPTEYTYIKRYCKKKQ